MTSEPVRRTILITNDDGIAAPGLVALRAALAPLGRVEVFAPDRNWSAASRTRTFHKPLRVDRVPLLDGSIGYATSGTPSDCVSLALLGLLDHRPDLIVSGINAGLNLGRDVSYSGTVAAAMEGVRAGIPSVAVSYDTVRAPSDDIDYARAAEFVKRFAAYLLETEAVPPGILLNVNVPYAPAARPLRVKLTRLGGEAYSNYLVTGKDPHGREYYWITGDPLTVGEEDGTDLGATAAGYVSITPIHLDMTEYSLLEKLRVWEEQLDRGS
ncbi:MAG: 5'/3'-nucleotidase SurE [Candidatus Bipolaricaulis sp.]|nr:5'/3'-nucleotidase SurE [Candidatus Bipolaricaulis sp.]MDD5647182.1 5'/3'-nucleotidase SurE [Candidatus Bipolaricaulis sp.]